MTTPEQHKDRFQLRSRTVYDVVDTCSLDMTTKPKVLGTCITEKEAIEYKKELERYHVN